MRQAVQRIAASLLVLSALLVGCNRLPEQASPTGFGGPMVRTKGKRMEVTPPPPPPALVRK
jgi:hypothetical protein